MRQKDRVTSIPNMFLSSGLHHFLVRDPGDHFLHLSAF